MYRTALALSQTLTLVLALASCGSPGHESSGAASKTSLPTTQAVEHTLAPTSDTAAAVSDVGPGDNTVLCDVDEQGVVHLSFYQSATGQVQPLADLDFAQVAPGWSVQSPGDLCDTRTRWSADFSVLIVGATPPGAGASQHILAIDTHKGTFQDLSVSREKNDFASGALTEGDPRFINATASPDRVKWGSDTFIAGSGTYMAGDPKPTLRSTLSAPTRVTSVTLDSDNLNLSGHPELRYDRGYNPWTIANDIFFLAPDGRKAVTYDYLRGAVRLVTVGHPDADVRITQCRTSGDPNAPLHYVTWVDATHVVLTTDGDVTEPFLVTVNQTGDTVLGCVKLLPPTERQITNLLPLPDGSALYFNATGSGGPETFSVATKTGSPVTPATLPPVLLKKQSWFLAIR